MPINQLSLIYLVKEHWLAKNQKTIPIQAFPSDFSLLQQLHGPYPPFKSGGAMRDRTADLLRARQALSQLSYSPVFAPVTKSNDLVGQGGFEPPTSPLSGVRSNQLSYRPI